MTGESFSGGVILTYDTWRIYRRLVGLFSFAQVRWLELKLPCMQCHTLSWRMTQRPYKLHKLIYYYIHLNYVFPRLKNKKNKIQIIIIKNIYLGLNSA